MEDEEAVAFRKRIESAVATVQAWDADPDLLAACRAQIPLLRRSDESNAADSSSWSRPEDAALSLSHRFVQRLARYFQNKMTWVNQPPCATCGGATKLQGVRGPESEEERQGGAARVEVYNCTAANQHENATRVTVTFANNAARPTAPCLIILFDAYLQFLCIFEQPEGGMLELCGAEASTSQSARPRGLHRRLIEMLLVVETNHQRLSSRSSFKS